jgi:hypothetical protein
MTTPFEHWGGGGTKQWQLYVFQGQNEPHLCASWMMDDGWMISDSLANTFLLGFNSPI